MKLDGLANGLPERIYGSWTNILIYSADSWPLFYSIMTNPYEPSRLFFKTKLKTREVILKKYCWCPLMLHQMTYILVKFKS